MSPVGRAPAAAVWPGWRVMKAGLAATVTPMTSEPRAEERFCTAPVRPLTGDSAVRLQVLPALSTQLSSMTQSLPMTLMVPKTA